MNLERDLEYSERSTKGKGILIIISVILAGMLIVSLIGFIRVKEERDILRQHFTTIQKEKGILQQKIEDMGKENEELKRKVESLTGERERIAKELASKRVLSTKKAKKK